MDLTPQCTRKAERDDYIIVDAQASTLDHARSTGGTSMGQAVSPT
jgi:uncharacterized NAD-dependent epimerase/dehydratase family protein